METDGVHADKSPMIRRQTHRNGNPTRGVTYPYSLYSYLEETIPNTNTWPYSPQLILFWLLQLCALLALASALPTTSPLSISTHESSTRISHPPQLNTTLPAPSKHTKNPPHFPLSKRRTQTPLSGVGRVWSGFEDWDLRRSAVCGRVDDCLRDSSSDHSQGNMYPSWVSCRCILIAYLPLQKHNQFRKFNHSECTLSPL